MATQDLTVQNNQQQQSASPAQILGALLMQGLGGVTNVNAMPNFNKQQQPQQQNKGMLQDLIENSQQQYNVGSLKSVSQDPTGGIKVDFHPKENPNAVATGESNNVQSSNTTQSTNANVGNQNQQSYVSAPTPFSLGGMNKQGQYEDQGAIIKLLELAATGRTPTGPEQASVIQQMLGQQPVQPTQKLEYGARMYGAKTEALNNQVNAYKDQLTSLVTELNGVTKSTGIIGRGQKINALLKSIDTTHKNLGKTLKSIREHTGQEKSIPSGATHYSPSQNKYYDAQGNEVQ